MVREFPDYTSAAGAAQLADRIAAYWRAQAGGGEVRVWVEPLWDGAHASRQAGRYRVASDSAVRSNLVGGLPPRQRPAAAER
jgi:hypothetical protein